MTGDVGEGWCKGRSGIVEVTGDVGEGWCKGGSGIVEVTGDVGEGWCKGRSDGMFPSNCYVEMILHKL